MFSEKEMAEAMATVSANYKEALVDRDNYRQWWTNERQKTEGLNTTIENQREDIRKLTEELNTIRDTGTIVVHDRACKEDFDANPEV